MKNLFSYNQLNVYLLPQTKTLVINIKSDADYQFLGHELLFEIESILSWAFDKIEIASILLAREEEGPFNLGAHPQLMAERDTEYWSKFYNKLCSLNQLILKLPQTVIVDLGMGAANYGIELALSADLRIGHVSGALNFNFLKLGLFPHLTQRLLSQYVGHSKSAQWMMLADNVSHRELAQAGLLAYTYDATSEDEVMQHILTKISQQLPVTRIQCKLSLNSLMLKHYNNRQEEDYKILQGTLVAEEWKLSELEQEDQETTTSNMLHLFSLSKKTKKEDEKKVQLKGKVLPFAP